MVCFCVLQQLHQIQCPDDKVVITHDDDWQKLLQEAPEVESSANLQIVVDKSKPHFFRKSLLKELADLAFLESESQGERDAENISQLGGFPTFPLKVYPSVPPPVDLYGRTIFQANAVDGR